MPPTIAITATTPIHSWSDAYRAMRARVGQVRGWIELDGNGPDRRWPRSTGLDVLLIAAFIDRELSHREHALPTSIARRWSMCKIDLEIDALDSYTETYLNNRSFWACLATVCAGLHADNWPVPPQTRWSALVAHLAVPRNAAPQYFYFMYRQAPPLMFMGAMKTFDLFWSQKTHFATLRGSDDRVPVPGMVGAGMETFRTAIPRTQNADVIQLAEFWTRLMSNPNVMKADGHANIASAWKAALDTIRQHARGKDPKAVYPENHRFWRAIATVSQHTAPAFPDLEGVQRLRQITLQDEAESFIRDTTKVIGAIGRGAESIAVGVAKGAAKTAGALFGGITTPLLIGGGAVLAFVLLRRSPQEAPRG